MKLIVAYKDYKEGKHVVISESFGQTFRLEFPLFNNNVNNADVGFDADVGGKKVKKKKRLGGDLMVKLSEILPKSRLSEEFQGEKTSLRDLKDKTIKILKVSDELSGDFGKFRLVQVKDGKELKVLIVNQNTTAYKKFSAVYNYLKENPNEEIEAKVVAKKSKNKRTYFDLE